MTFYGGAAGHYLPYDVLTAIPAQILLTRDPEQGRPEKDARLVHNAFLLQFFVAMPWLKPKQVREARIYGAANVFKGPLNAHITVPEWAMDELRRDPAAELWQVRFSHMETGGLAIHTFLPRNVVPLLEEYLDLHRPLLARGNDPGTLFLGKRGPLGARQLNALIGNLTERFAGRRILPSWVRRAVALSWLKDHPDDYFTLSRILGLRTIPKFWPRPSASSVMCSFEEWLKNRKRN